MDPRISIVTLGVRSLRRSVVFYRDGLGWPVSKASVGDIIFFKSGGCVLALYPGRLLAKDARIKPGNRGFSGITLAHNVRKPAEVDSVLRQASKAGAKILKAAKQAFWGGRSGYFADPDGHVWEVAWNPGFVIAKDGDLKLP